MDFLIIKSIKAAYRVLITFQLTCIGIKYGVSKTNPFQDSTLSLLVTAVFSHVIASAADMNKPNTIITFYLSGIVASETLITCQILVLSLPHSAPPSLLQLHHSPAPSLLRSFNCITQLLPGTPPNDVHMPNTEPAGLPGVASQI
ncbi:hypothetical protein DEO72_LG1g1699 [Vigna unguiculata]|uniref:Uncharacterized protein n=1 Tax=Vigna unguiculata TaxID=3917 RepID=A0A4D6KN17_VIGUN|nr:hypothetical protein DEO72_LG1g1699 [Vigna unguiculata]